MNYADLSETVGLVALGVVIGAIATAARTVMLSEKSFAGLVVTLDALLQARDAVMVVGLFVFTIGMAVSVALEYKYGEL